MFDSAFKAQIIRAVAGLVISLGITMPAIADLDVESVRYHEDEHQIKIKGVLEGQSGSVDAIVSTSWGVLVDTQMKVNKGKGRFNLPVNLGSAPVPCSINLSAGGDSVDLAVSRAGDCIVTGAQISGTVNGLPGAEITIQVGSDTYTTQADGGGDFSVIVGGDPEALVTVTATGTGSDSIIELVSILGTLTDVSESNNGDINNVTTARYVLVIDANGGTEVTTEEELNNAEKSVSAANLLELATVIQIVIEDPDWSLPSGYSSVLEFAADEDAVEVFVADVQANDPGLYEDTLAAILENEDLLPEFTVAGVPDAYYGIPPAVPGFLARGGVAYEFGNGSGRLIQRDGGYEFNWQVVDGDLVLDFVNPPVNFSSPGVALLPPSPERDQILAEWGNDAQINEFRTLHSRTITLISDGNLVDIVSIADDVTREFDTVTLATGDVTVPTINEITYGESELRDSGAIDAISWNDVSLVGNWGMDSYFQIPVNFVGTGGNVAIIEDLVTLNADGSASGRISGNTMSWTVEATSGDLLVDLPGGETQRVRILDNLGKQYGFFTIIESGGGVIAANYNFAVRQASASIFDINLMANTGDEYWQSFVNAWSPVEYLDGVLQGVFGWQVTDDANQSFKEMRGFANGDGTFTLYDIPQYHWDFEADGSFVFEGKRWQVCIDLDEDCHKRRWIPLDVDGDTIYMIEQAYIKEVWIPGNDYIEYFPHRLNIYKRWNQSYFPQ